MEYFEEKNDTTFLQIGISLPLSGLGAQRIQHHLGPSSSFVFVLSFIYFERELPIQAGEGQREKKRVSSRLQLRAELSMEPAVGLDLTTPGS